MAETRRKFDPDFREGAVRLVRETGRPIAEVARDLVNEGTPATGGTSARPSAPHGHRPAHSHARLTVERFPDPRPVARRMTGRLHHIGAGRSHAGTHVLPRVLDLRIRVINAPTGELLRGLTLDPSRNYQ